MTKRRVHWPRIATLLLVALLVSPAHATVIEQVPVRLIDTPSWADSSVREVAVAIVAARAGRVDHVTVLSDGIPQRLISAPSGEFAAGDSVIVRFLRSPGAEHGLLVVRFEFGGGAQEAWFDFTDANDHWRAYRARLKAQQAAAAGPGRVSPGAVQTTRAINVHGSAQAIGPRGESLPLDNAEVDVYQQSSPGNVETALGTTTAALDGSFALTVQAQVTSTTNPNLFVRLRATSSDVSVIDVFSNSPTEYDDKTHSNVPGFDLDVGTIIPGLYSADFATFVLLGRAQRWVTSIGHPIGPAQAIVGTQAAGSFYDPPTQRIHYAPSDAWSTWSIGHEFGHLWLYRNNVAPALNYCAIPCNQNPDGTCVAKPAHYEWCASDPTIAWCEGFPDWLGAVFTSEQQKDYGWTNLERNDSFERLSGCSACGSTGQLAPPEATEGFTAAFLWDLTDSAPDDEPNHLPPDRFARDEVSIPVKSVLDVVTFSAPLNTVSFFQDLALQRPSQVFQFWEAGLNCRLDFDLLPPAPVLGLTSTDQATGVASNDDIFSFSWPPPADDVSGVDQYYYSFSQGAPQVPDGTQVITDLSSWTSPPLSSGSWYFNIRAVDRDLRHGALISYGPYIVNPPGMVDFAYSTPAGWAQPLVPRLTADATATNVPTPSSLTSTDQIYLNWAYTNVGTGGSSANDDAQFIFDGVWTGAMYTWFIGLPPGQVRYVNNFALGTLPGGRYTFGYQIDSAGRFAEAVELNNQWGHQWVIAPTDVTNLGLFRKKPPWPARGGLETIKDGSAAYESCRGYRFNTTGTWDAVSLRPYDGIANFDLKLFYPSNFPTNGFDALPVEISDSIEDLDAILVNAANASGGTWDVGVYNPTGVVQDYWFEHMPSQSLPYPSLAQAVMPDSSSLRIFDFTVPPASQGITVALQVTDPSPVSTPLELVWFEPGTAVASLARGNGFAETDQNGFTSLELEPTASGSSCIAVYRRPDSPQGLVNFSLAVQPTPENLSWAAPPGWYSPLVPHAAADGTDLSVPAPSELDGDITLTYINVAVQNAGATPFSARPSGTSKMAAPHATTRAPADATSAAKPAANQSVAIPVEIHLDGTTLTTLTSSGLTGGASQLFHVASPFLVSGGRHVLSAHVDPSNLEGQPHPTNAVFGDTWVWQPATLAIGASSTRGAPPDPTGGWHELTAAASPTFNCDGLRLPTPSIVGQNGHWQALATVPGASSDVDLALFEASSGARSGFDSSLVQSHAGHAQTDYVLANFNLASPRAFDVGITRSAGTESYFAETVSSLWLGSGSSGVFGPFTLGAGHALALHEISLPAGPCTIQLENLSGTVDWGLSVHGPTQTFASRDTTLSGGEAWLAGPGVNEVASVLIPAPGRVGIAVWKTSRADLNSSGTFQIRITPGLAAVGPSDLPTQTNIRSVSPNPQTTSSAIEFDMAQAGDAELAVYDLRGALIRDLHRGQLDAGRHVASWDGRDGSGRRVAGGVYFVRLDAVGHHDTRKVVLLE